MILCQKGRQRLAKSFEKLQILQYGRFLPITVAVLTANEASADECVFYNGMQSICVPMAKPSVLHGIS